MPSLEDQVSHTQPYPQSRPKPPISRRTSILARISHTFITGCALGLLFTLYSLQERKDQYLHRHLSPQLSPISPLYFHHIKKNSPHLHPSLLHDPPSPLPSNNTFDAFSPTGIFYYTSDSRGRKALQRSNGQSVLPDLSYDEIAVFPNEQHIATLLNDQLHIYSINQGAFLPSIPLPPHITSFHSNRHPFAIQKRLHVSPDNTSVLAISSFCPPTLTFFTQHHPPSLITHHIPSGCFHHGSWINGHHYLAQVTNHQRPTTLEELIHFTPTARSVIFNLNQRELLIGATPLQSNYFTAEDVSTPTPPDPLSQENPEEFTSDRTILLRIRTTTGAPVANHFFTSFPQGTTFSDQGHAAIVHGNGPDNHFYLPSRITILPPPTYTSPLHIPDATDPFFSTPSTLTYWSTKGLFSKTNHHIRQVDLSNGVDQIIHPQPSFWEDFISTCTPVSLSLLPFFFMGLYYYHHEHRKHTASETRHPSWTLLPPSLFPFLGSAIAFSVFHPNNPTHTFLGKTIGKLFLFTLSGNASLLLYSYYNYFETFKPPRLASFFKYLDYGLRSGPPTPPGEMTYVEVFRKLPSSTLFFFRGDEFTQHHQYGNARLSYYQAITETLLERQPPPCSYFHFLGSHSKRFISYIYYQFSRLKKPQTAQHRTGMLESYQSRLLSLRLFDPALSLTDKVLSMNPSDAGVCMHQARIHSLLGSPRADALWERAITSLLPQVPPDAFARVAGGTSEVLRVPDDLNPYAGKTLILKRSPDTQQLHREATLTSAISAATGGMHGLSSTPLAFVHTLADQINVNAPNLSYLPLLQHPGDTLSHFCINSSKSAIETHLREHILTYLADYHLRLEQAQSTLATILKPIDYRHVYLAKFVQRIGLSSTEQDALLQAGMPIITYLESQPSAPIHNDLHASNVLTGPPHPLFIDPADATLGHPFLDVAHLLHDPHLHLDGGTITSLMEEYRRLRHHNPSRTRAADTAATWHRLCHLVGRDIAYQRPHEQVAHAFALASTTYALTTMDIPGCTMASLKPVLQAAQPLTG